MNAHEMMANTRSIKKVSTSFHSALFASSVILTMLYFSDKVIAI